MPEAKPLKARFEGRGVLITGGGAGIGAAAAHQFANEGAKLVIIDRDEVAGRGTVGALVKAGHDATFFAADVANDAEIDAGVAKAIKLLGKVDVLHNHAGTVVVNSIVDTCDTQFDHVMNTNVRSAFRICRTIAGHMRDQGGGSIVISSSICASRAFEFEAAYCMSKAALVMLAKCLATEFRDAGVRANAVCPAFVGTGHGYNEIDAFAKLGIAWDESSIAELQGRMCAPEEVANAVLFLASDEASFISGVDLHVDNGWSSKGG